MKKQRKHSCTIRQKVEDCEKQLTDVKSQRGREENLEELAWSKEDKINHKKTQLCNGAKKLCENNR